MSFVCLFSPSSSAPKLARADCSVVSRACANDLVTVWVPQGRLSRHFAEHGDWCGAGDVRLDKVDWLPSTTGRQVEGESDLHQLTTAVAEGGIDILSEIHGDFAVTIWNRVTGETIAARDPMGIKTLFWSQHGNERAFTSHLEMLPTRRELDDEFIADYLVLGYSSNRTIWRDCHQCSTGAAHIFHDGDHKSVRYWSPERVASSTDTEAEAVERFKEYFKRSVWSCLDGPCVWSQLSGGLDSSSVVCTADHLARSNDRRRQLAGTLTLLDWFTGGTDARYSRVVSEHTSTPNARLVNYHAWRDFPDVPLAPQPYTYFPYAARYRDMWALMYSNGATALLSGAGSDEVLLMTLLHLSDAMSTGDLRSVISQLSQWTTKCGHSVWEAVFNLLMTTTRPRVRERAGVDIPPWITKEFERQFGLVDRIIARGGEWAPKGEKYRSALTTAFSSMLLGFDRPAWDSTVEMRYPFLYRPLVEYCIALPPMYKNRPGQTKWVLREAMRGILPDEIRCRGAKDGIGGNYQWSLKKYSAAIEYLLDHSILAQRGIIDSAALAEHIGEAKRGSPGHSAHLMFTLSMETWLAVSEGRWIGAKAA